MSDDTISKIKLRLNNNSRLKQSTSAKVAALSNRMSATDYSACNDFFANCCGCCESCECCPCLSGFFIIVSGWQDGVECTCTTLNGGPVWAPRHTLDIDPTKICDQAGQTPGFQSFGFYDCHPSKKDTSLEWTVFCEGGKLWLSVVTNSNLSYSLGGSLSIGVVAELLIEVEDCDSLAVDEIVDCEVGSGSPDCICPDGIRIQTFPVFGQQLPAPYPPLPEECLCCRSERCEVEEPGCLNPFPDILTMTFSDDCPNTQTVPLNKGEGLCWYSIPWTASCDGCDWVFSALFCCDGSNGWYLYVYMVEPDSFVCSSIGTNTFIWANSTTNVEIIINNCDPLSFSPVGVRGIFCDNTGCGYSMYNVSIFE